MSDLKPSDVEGIVKELEALAMSKVNIPADATALQKYTTLYKPIAGDEDLNHSQTEWYLGSCLFRAVAEITAGVDLQEYPKEITDNVRNFAQMVNESVAKLRLLYSVFAAWSLISSTTSSRRANSCVYAARRVSNPFRFTVPPTKRNTNRSFN